MTQWRAIQDTVPLAVAFVLYSTISSRYDLKPKGPTYVVQEMLEAMEKAGEQQKA